MVSPDSRYGQWESISNIYITKIVVLVFEPVRGRSRATELPCYVIFHVVSKTVQWFFIFFSYIVSIGRKLHSAEDLLPPIWSKGHSGSPKLLTFKIFCNFFQKVFDFVGIERASLWCYWSVFKRWNQAERGFKIKRSIKCQMWTFFLNKLLLILFSNLVWHFPIWGHS